MPPYEYSCQKCGNTIELLARDGEKPASAA